MSVKNSEYLDNTLAAIGRVRRVIQDNKMEDLFENGDLDQIADFEYNLNRYITYPARGQTFEYCFGKAESTAFNVWGERGEATKKQRNKLIIDIYLAILKNDEINSNDSAYKASIIIANKITSFNTKDCTDFSDDGTSSLEQTICSYHNFCSIQNKKPVGDKTIENIIKEYLNSVSRETIPG